MSVLQKQDKNGILPTSTNNRRVAREFWSEWRKLRAVSGKWYDLPAEEYARSVKVAPVWRKLGVAWGKAFTFYFSVLPKHVAAGLHTLLTRLRIDKFRDDKSLRTGLSGLSETAKLLGERFSVYWKYLVSLDTLGGPLEVEDVDLYPMVEEWVGVDRKKDDDFYDLFEEGAQAFFELNGRDTAVLTPAEWASEPWRWGGGGSSKYRGQYSEGGAERKTRTKWGMAVIASPEYVLGILNGATNLVSTNRAVAKRENTKIRAVVNSDDATYLRMSYISSFLEPQLVGNDKSPLFLKGRELEGFWRRWMSYSSVRDCVKMPLDQSHFDWHTTTRMLRIVLKVIHSRLPAVMQGVMAVLMRSILDVPTYVDVRDGNVVRHVRIKGGLISGWRWTSLLGTAINWAEAYAVRMKVTRSVGWDPASFVAAQGDDDVFICKDWVSALLVYDAYRQWGFDINPKKFFMSLDRDEFLRLVTDGKTINGYPARGVGSVLWRKPLRTLTLRTNEAASLWLLLLRRGLNVRRHMTIDLANMNNADHETVDLWINTPASMGGFGLSPLQFSDPVRLKYSFSEDNRRVNMDVSKAWSPYLRYRGVYGYLGQLISGYVPGVSVSFEHIARERMRTTYPVLASLPMEVAWVDGFPVMLSDLVVSSVTLDEVRTLVRPDRLSVFDRFRKVMSRSVFYDWLKGKLPYKSGARTQGSLVVNNVMKNMVSGELFRLSCLSVVRRGDVLASAMRVEAALGGLDSMPMINV